ncbi:MAG: type II CAAX endopeptidase family protein [Cyanobacteria bacterium P01_G01_bin.49]
MSIKRIALIVITIISLIPVFLSLITSINQPQVQSNLQLYQTNLVLQASEFSWENLNQFEGSRNILLGKDSYQLALNQYQEARKTAQETLVKLEDQSQKIESQLSIIEENRLKNESPQLIPLFPENTKLKQEIKEQQKTLNELDIKSAILEAHQGNNSAALETWKNIQNQSFQKNTANILAQLWKSQPESLPDSETILKTQLNGWFRYESLKKLYQVKTRKADLLALEKQQQTIALQALIKLSLVAFIPIIGGTIGFGLLIFFIVQLALKKEEATLSINQTLAWKTSWNWEIIWQVLVVGFFFMGQIILPILFSLLNIDATQFNLREKAIYVLVSYFALAVSGIGVLYLSIKKFFPLPKDWFQFNWLSNWIVWGIGGYLVALPLVVIVSLINQKIWNGQGGSNPLLSLALESQDWTVLAIFYVTAAIAAPLYEEIMFRGFLLPSLTRYISVWGAIGASSLLFAVAHLNLSEVLPLAVLGMVLGVVYTRSRNLLASMLLHSLWNSGTLISLFLLGSGNN